MRPTTDLPLVRLSLLAPLIEGTDAEGVDIGPMLARHQLDRSMVVSGELFVPARTMYDLVERISEASADPFFGLHQGERLDPWLWPPLANAASGAGTVGECLLRFSLVASQEASSIIFGIETAGPRSTFSGRRVTDGGIQPRHNDGFSIGYVLRILRSAVGDAWDGKRVLARVCDPEVIPTGYLHIRLARGDTMGFTIDFPTEWLLLPLRLGEPRKTPSLGRDTPVATLSTVDALKQVLIPHLNERDLDAQRVADAIGLSKRTLARRLSAENTSFRAELEQLRRRRAEALLGEGNLSIAEVGTEVGYPDAAVFSRTFRRWHGCSPSAYRARVQIT